MKPEQENFDSLRRLLKLKRYEQPPPRYFNDFSSQVIARLRAGENGGRETAPDSAFWLSRVWSILEAKPMLPGAVGLAICALLVFGAVYTERTESAPGPVFSEIQPAPPASASVFALGQNLDEQPAMPFTSTNPVIQIGGSLFDQIGIKPRIVDAQNSLIPLGRN